MNNTIRLVYGSGNCPMRHWMKDVQPGDAIFGIDNDAEVLKTWSISDETAAKAELANLRCTYQELGGTMFYSEYALEYCECDDDGEFICGSDFWLAEHE